VTPRTAIIVAFIGVFLTAHSASNAQTDEEERRLEALKALPYAKWTQREVDESRHGVLIHDRTRAHAGYTLYAGPVRASLINMEGEVVHDWSHPDLVEWEHAEMLENGDLMVILLRRGVFRLDWNGNLVWSAAVAAHHDVCVAPDGDVLTLVIEEVTVPEISAEPIESDAIVTLDAAGRVTDTWHLHEHRDELARWCPPEALTSVSKDVPDNDWSHSNTLELITENPIHERLAAFRPGNLLFCVRNLDFVGIIDGETGEIVWGWGPGVLDHPHQPTLLENGNILVFDNGFFRGFSRIVEYDPLAERIVWEYRPEIASEFFSRGRGSCQELPNGNVLITESGNGRVFEVTREGRIVWSYFNRERDRNRRGTFYRTIRYEPELVERLLAAGE